MPTKRTDIFTAALLLWAFPLWGQVSVWNENAENGLAAVRDFTTADYDLIQSSVFSEGQNAFHLANPDFEDNWFEIDQTISVTSTTNLFFTSQLRAATEFQVAQVQLSMDSGQSWPNSLFSQPGNGFPGEGTFGLKTIPLADFAGQDVQLRFILDFQGTSAFNQTDAAAGWFVDDIQIGADVSKEIYSIGDPSPEATLYLELINRSRADAIGEAQRLADTTNARLSDVISQRSIDREDIVAQYEWAADVGCIDRVAQPLAFNAALLEMADLHSEDQFVSGIQGHVSSDDPPAPFLPGDTIGQRAERVEYGFRAISENVFTDSENVEFGHAAFEIDWGNASIPSDECYNPDFGGQGMQNPAGHRLNIHDDVMKEVGIGVVPNDDGSHVVTQNFGTPGDARFATGVVYDDENNNGFYDIGEGLAGVQIDSDASAFFAVSTESGAYAIPISEDGNQVLTFAAPGLAPFQTMANFQDGSNVKVDFVLGGMQAVTGDFNFDGNLDVMDIDALSAAVRANLNNPAFDLDQNGRVDQADRASWLEFTDSLLGDANLDGNVEFLDFLALANGFGQPDAGWGDGDFNGSGVTEFLDFLTLANNFGATAPVLAASVPEPSANLLGAFCLSLLMCSRRRR